jgi:two-component system, NtrC family, response regulator GlrR
VIGRAPAFTAALARLDRIAGCLAPVLLEGETGTGKELVAREIHYRSARRAGPFVPVNCGALPDSLLENELFGHARGAYTDAHTAQPGMVDLASGGTLFLDEVDALTPKAQVTLLRFLQDQRFRPLGSREERIADVRIVAASNRSLEQLARAERFRMDLLYRLRLLHVLLPPLRERYGDAALLAHHFVEVASRRFGGPIRPIDAETLAWFDRYAWPGNVRELENLVLQAFLVEEGPTISIRPPEGMGDHTDADPTAPLSYRVAKSLAIAAFERSFLTRALTYADGNISAAARMIGTERRHLGRLLKKHGIETTATS